MFLRIFPKLRLMSLSVVRIASRRVSLIASATRLNISQTSLFNHASPRLLFSARPLSDKSSAPVLCKELHDRLVELTTRTRIVVLMKGTPMQPRCGFSNAVCRILEAHGVLEKNDASTGHPIVSSFDILSDEEIREGAKAFSDWPTFPQVFFDGEFIGGCDILLDMHRSGKLASELVRLGIGSLLTEEKCPP
ncbi:unnamed protein product [Mesocestoides corti]|uniref:Glutaredoxin domain-containing protein n=2 Tax=Mesocestoides corti TaxID=53468 RepID=A0A0R3ULK8_MESCO|nr:unnamed protein product [Mesocestoides corti]